MVNTFLISPSFEYSLRALDWRRLGKQRVEALQIYNILRRSHYIAKFLHLEPMPSLKDFPGSDGDFLREQWLSKVYSTYKQSGIILYEQEVSDGFIYSLCQLEGTSSPEGSSKPISSGFSSHTASSMWIGYEQALKYYINLSICEWTRRGYKNTIKMYIVFEDDIVYPWWASSIAFHKSNISALLRKEIVRKEPRWYQNFLNVEQEWLEKGYLWPSHLSPEQRKEVILHPSAKFCDPIQKDFLENLLA